LLPKVERRFRFPGRNRRPDRGALQGILFVLHTGIAWRHLPRELGFGSGSTCYRRLDEWQRAGVWERLHALLLAELRAAGELEWSRAVASLRVFLCIGGWLSVVRDAVSEVDAQDCHRLRPVVTASP
jgi:transposase